MHAGSVRVKLWVVSQLPGSTGQLHLEHSLVETDLKFSDCDVADQIGVWRGFQTRLNEVLPHVGPVSWTQEARRPPKVSQRPNHLAPNGLKSSVVNY